MISIAESGPGAVTVPIGPIVRAMSDRRFYALIFGRTLRARRGIGLRNECGGCRSHNGDQREGFRNHLGLQFTASVAAIPEQRLRLIRSSLSPPLHRAPCYEKARRIGRASPLYLLSVRASPKPLGARIVLSLRVFNCLPIWLFRYFRAFAISRCCLRCGNVFAAQAFSSGLSPPSA